MTTTKRKREEEEAELLLLTEGVDDFLAGDYDEAEDITNIDLATAAFGSDDDSDDDEHPVCTCSFNGVYPATACSHSIRLTSSPPFLAQRLAPGCARRARP